MKGRDGQVGEFSIAWDFDVMNFDQTEPAVSGSVEMDKQLDWM
jgi:hypothetical protein